MVERETVESPPDGIYVPVPTFFCKGSTGQVPPLDLDTQERHALFLLRANIQGLVLLGSTGEAVSITSHERSTLVRRVRKTLDTHGFTERPLIVSTASQAVDEVVAQLDDARDAGADYGLVLAPGFFAPATSQAGLVEWYTTIADRTSLPILLYNYPAVTNGLFLTPDTLCLLSQHPRIVGCKLSHGDLATHARVATDSIPRECFAVFTGMASQLLPAMSVGCAGAVDGLAASYPNAAVQIFRRFQATEPDWTTLRRLQAAVAQAYDPISKYGVAAIKAAVQRVVTGCETAGVMRLPLRALDVGEWGECGPRFDKLADATKDLSD